MKDLKVVQYGCGKMAKYTMRYIMEKGGIIVGAIDINKDIIGKDISKVIGCEDTGVVISSIEEAELILKMTKPDVCIVETMSLMKDVEEALMLCAKLGINAISTCEEAFYPMVSSPNITKEIDSLAKKTGCTITGSGYQDVFWGNLITTLAGATQTIKQIKGSSSYNVEDYGIALAKAHGCGLTIQEFNEQIATLDDISIESRQKLIENGEFLPSYMWNASAWICDKLGLTIESQIQKCVPITCDSNIHSTTLGMDIKKGDAIGMSAVVITKTKENIEIEAKCIGKVYTKDVVDVNEWEIIGEPNTKVVIKQPSTVELTCATVVNRMQDLLKARSGFVPTSELGELKYTK